MNTRNALSLLLALLMLILGACISCAQAESVFSLPESLTTIEEGAFEGDAKLRGVKLPEHVKSIGRRAFAGSGLNEIYFCESLTDVAEDAFDGCGHIEAHAYGDAGKALIARLAGLGYDIVWADEILNAVTTYDLRAASGQTIQRTFSAPKTGRYTFSASGSAPISVIRYDKNGGVIAEKEGSLSFNLQEGGEAFLGFRFAEDTASGSFSLHVSHAEDPMAALLYTPSLRVCKDDEPLRDASMNGSLAQLGVGEVLTPALTIENSENRRVSGQVFANLDGQVLDLGFFALGALENCTLYVPSSAAFAAETGGSHTIEYAVKLVDTETVAAMTWEIKDARPAETNAAVVKTGVNTIELSEADGNLFKFVPSKTGVYQIYTSTSNCDTYAALRDSQRGIILTSDDDSGSPYQNFMFSYTLTAGVPVYIDVGMKNYKGAIDVTLNIISCGTPSLKYSTSLYVFDGYSWIDADDGNLNGTGMIKLKNKGNLSTLTLEEYLTPVLKITNSSSKDMPLGLTAVIDGETVYWSGDCTIPGSGTFTAYLYSTAARMYEKPGMHTIDYYVNGKLATSYTWEVTGNRTPQIYSGSPMLNLGGNYRSLDDIEGSFDWFQAPYSGVYRFYSSCRLWDTCGFLFDENMNLVAYNDDYGGSEDFTIYYYLEAGQIVYLQSMLFEDMRDTATIGVEFVSTPPVPPIALTLGDRPMPMAANDIFTASFTAPKDGQYRFYAEGSGFYSDIKAELYDTSWQQLSVNTSGVTGYFNLRYTMKKDETVYLKVTCSKSDPDAVLTILCLTP